MDADGRRPVHDVRCPGERVDAHDAQGVGLETGGSAVPRDGRTSLAIAAHRPGRPTRAGEQQPHRHDDHDRCRDGGDGTDPSSGARHAPGALARDDRVEHRRQVEGRERLTRAVLEHRPERGLERVGPGVHQRSASGSRAPASYAARSERNA